MKKFPHLEALRAERDRVEEEITAPVRAEAAEWRSRADTVGKSLNALEQFLARDIAPHILREVASGLGHELRRKVYEATAKVSDQQKPVAVWFYPREVGFLDSALLERKILDAYIAKNMPRLKVRAYSEGASIIEETFSVIDISIPSFGCRQRVVS